MNSENLRPQNTRTKSEQREIAKKGGVASGKARRERKKLKEYLEAALELPSANEPGQTNADAICSALIKRALAGDSKAFVTIRDTVGEKPQEYRAVSIEPEISPEAYERVALVLGLTEENESD